MQLCGGGGHNDFDHSEARSVEILGYLHGTKEPWKRNLGGGLKDVLSVLTLIFLQKTGKVRTLFSFGNKLKPFFSDFG